MSHYDYGRDAEYIAATTRVAGKRTLDRPASGDDGLRAFLVRVTPAQHAAITAAARASDVSANAYCVAVLLGAATGRLSLATATAPLTVAPRRPRRAELRPRKRTA